MPLFTIATASGLSDRLGAIVQAVHNAVTPARVGSPSVAAPGGFFSRVTLTSDYNVENNFLTPTYNADQDLSGLTILGSDPRIQALVQAFDLHIQQNGAVSYDTYCTNSGLRNSEFFAGIYGQVKGIQLSSRNVFASNPIVVASVNKVGSLNWTFEPGTPLGSGGTAKYANSSTTTAAQLIVAALPSGVSTSSCTMSVSGLDDNGNISQASFSFPNGIANAQVLVSPTVRFNSITNVAVTADTGIGNGSTVTFINQKERVITF